MNAAHLPILMKFFHTSLRTVGQRQVALLLALKMRRGELLPPVPRRGNTQPSFPTIARRQLFDRTRSERTKWSFTMSATARDCGRGKGSGKGVGEARLAGAFRQIQRTRSGRPGH